MLTKPAIRILVREAVDQKYQTLSDDDFRLAFEGAWSNGAAANDEQELEELLKPVDTPSVDVQNQVVVALLIDRYWRKNPLSRPITTLHSAVYGIGTRHDIRTMRHLDDYGGELPTPVSELPSRLDELERLAEALTPTMTDAGVAIQARFLALMISSIVRIHPFNDGNGRAARMYTQYALRSWDRPFLPLPKVRNNSDWKAAMSGAVRGQLDELTWHLESRLRSLIAARGKR